MKNSINKINVKKLSKKESIHIKGGQGLSNSTGRDSRLSNTGGRDNRLSNGEGRDSRLINGTRTDEKN